MEKMTGMEEERLKGALQEQEREEGTKEACAGWSKQLEWVKGEMTARAAKARKASSVW